MELNNRRAEIARLQQRIERLERQIERGLTSADEETQQKRLAELRGERDSKVQSLREFERGGGAQSASRTSANTVEVNVDPERQRLEADTVYLLEDSEQVKPGQPSPASESLDETMERLRQIRDELREEPHRPIEYDGPEQTQDRGYDL